MVPARPLVYVQCSQLKLHLDQLSQSTIYHEFLQSPFVQQLKTTIWWNEFSDEFQEFWDNMLIDPMRVFGNELAVGMYKTEVGEMFPGLILVSRIDRLAGAAERLLYLFDRISEETGIRFAQEVEGVPVYVLDQQDLFFPIYYSVVEDFGVISTSFPLLKTTILQALGITEERRELSPFQKIVHNIPDSRFMTWYAHPKLLSRELRDNQLLQALKFMDNRSLDAASDFPFISISLDVYPHDAPMMRVDLVSESAIDHDKAYGEKAEEPGVPEIDRHDEQSISDAFPMIGIVHTEDIGAFAQTLNTMFPRQQFQWTAIPRETFGKILECRLSGKLFGTLYTIPDISCVLDVVDSDQALTFIDTHVEELLDQVFPSVAQRALLKKSAKMYQQTNVTSLSMLFQDMFCYTILNSRGNSEFSYALAATSSEVLKKRIDRLLASPIHAPYTFMTPEHVQGENAQHVPKNVAVQREVSVAVLLLQYDLFSEWLAAISRTTTFSLAFPRKTYPQLYHILPDLLVFLKSLPPMLFELKMQKNRRLFVTIRISEENSNTEGAEKGVFREET